MTVQDEYGHTALHYACGQGHLQVAEELVAHGAEINQDVSTLIVAAQGGKLEMVKWLVEKGNNNVQKYWFI